MAMDVGFSFPAALAAVIKENILQLNKQLTASRYLKGVNIVGGVSRDIGESSASLLRERLKGIEKDFLRLRDILESSTSFMERVDTTGYLRRNTAYDLGVIGLAGRSSGIEIDLRKFFGDIYKPAGFNMAIGRSGDVLARLNVRLFEFEESLRLIRYFVGHLAAGACVATQKIVPGYGLGYAEAWRGPVLYWLDIAEDGTIERCKITDPSFRGWQGLSYAVLGDIIPDFPLCNKSFDFSYAGNDL
jgi:Ni,Fe-hydrogenase III large subunit